VQCTLNYPFVHKLSVHDGKLQMTNGEGGK